MSLNHIPVNRAGIRQTRYLSTSDDWDYRLLKHGRRMSVLLVGAWLNISRYAMEGMTEHFCKRNTFAWSRDYVRPRPLEYKAGGTLRHPGKNGDWLVWHLWYIVQFVLKLLWYCKKIFNLVYNNACWRNKKGSRNDYKTTWFQMHRYRSFF